MHWQDYVITTGLIIFGVALIPSVIGKDKPALSTSLITGTVMVIFAATYVTLHLWFSAISQLLTSLVWLTLAVQKYAQIRSAAKPPVAPKTP